MQDKVLEICCTMRGIGLYYQIVHLKFFKIVNFMLYVIYHNKKSLIWERKCLEFTHIDTQLYNRYDPGWKDPGFSTWCEVKKRLRAHLSKSTPHLWVPLDATQSSNSFEAVVLQFSRSWTQANSSKADRNSRADGEPSSVQFCCWIWLWSNLDTLF